MKYLTAIMIILFFSVTLVAGYAKIVKNDKNSAFAPSLADASFVAPDVKLVESFKKTTPDNVGIQGISMSEVEKHSSPTDCYMVINNNVYDVSGYGADHPGGSSAIYDNCGKEVTGLFARIHSNAAWDLLKKYKIDVLKIGFDSPDMAAIAKAFEKSNPGSKVMRIKRSGDNYELEITKNGVLHKLTLDSSYSIISKTAIGKETPSYIWKANKKESFFGDFDDKFEKGEGEGEYEYEDYDD